MSDILALKDTPVPTILVIGGMVFLFLAIAGQITGEIKVPTGRQKISAVLGIILLVSGILLYVIPSSTAETLTSTPTSTLTSENSQQVNAPTESTSNSNGTQQPSTMEFIYNAIKLENIKTDRTIYASGDDVIITYELVNRSDETIVVPENTDYSQSFYLVGTIQRWIERLGNENYIPSSAARDGNKYAAGGEIIPITFYKDGTTLTPGESIPLEITLNTANFSEGLYRFYVEYKKLEGDVLQTVTTEFKVQGYLFTPVPTNTVPAVIPPTPTPQYGETELLLDQSQDGINYGFWFDKDVVRWQEFIPTVNTLTAVEIYIGKSGNPYDLIFELRNSQDLTLATEIIPSYYVPQSGWLRVYLTNPLSIQPGNKYRIAIYSNNDNSLIASQYVWRGNTASEYCAECENSVIDGWAEFDFAFRTYGYNK
jgi:hypothetical protein